MGFVEDKFDVITGQPVNGLFDDVAHRVATIVTCPFQFFLEVEGHTPHKVDGNLKGVSVTRHMDVQERLEALIQPCLDGRVAPVLSQESHETREKHVGIGFLVDPSNDFQFVHAVLTFKVSMNALGQGSVQERGQQLLSKPRSAALVAQDVGQGRNLLRDGIAVKPARI